jgi:transposase-like protein
MKNMKNDVKSKDFQGKRIAGSSKMIGLKIQKPSSGCNNCGSKYGLEFYQSEWLCKNCR